MGLIITCLEDNREAFWWEVKSSPRPQPPLWSVHSTVQIISVATDKI